jgi:hypothetical protein
MIFRTRTGAVFTGPSGRATFTVVRGHVTGLTLTPTAILAKRLEERRR